MTDKFRFCRERKIDTSVDGLFAIGARGVIGKSENIERQRPGQLMFQLDVDRESGDLKKKFDEWQVRDNYLNMLMIKTNDMRCNRCEIPEDVRKNKDWLIEMFLNGAVIHGPFSVEFDLFLEFYQRTMYSRRLIPVRTEMSIFHCGLICAGQVDLLAKYEDTSEYVIIDWKRCKQIQ